MSGIKRMLEEVAERMEIDDPNDPRVEAEANRLLSLGERRFVVLETHPNSGGCWVGKLGTGSEVLEYLKDLEKKGQLDYVGNIIELKEKADEETQDWLKLDDYQPVGVLVRPVFSSPEGTPPLPGLEKRLAGIEAEVYGQKRSVWSLLQAMTDEEIALSFGDVLEEVLQSGRELPKVGEPSCGT